MTDSTPYPRLLSPFAIGHVPLKNRMVKLAASMGVAQDDGQVSDLNLCFYGTIAKGGMGLILVEHGFVDFPFGVSGPGRIGNSSDRHLSGLTALAGVIHASAVPCFIQLGHSGPAQHKCIQKQPVAASALLRSEAPHPTYPQARSLSPEEIKGLVEKYARAALRAKKAGFDGVEVHGAHNYLINSFFSRAWNRRRDEYGADSLENRTRLACEILRAVRAAVGQAFIVGVRINGAEYGIRDGLTPDESRQIARHLEQNGAQYLNVTAWGFGPYDRLTYPEQILFPEPQVALAAQVKRPGALAHLAAAVKGAVKIPVIAAGRLSAELGEAILERGEADLIGLNRRFWADMEYGKKIAEGRLEDIAPCMGCLECLSRLELAQPIRCRINAAFGRGHDFAMKPTERRKKVMVVGGGPAGMEAARVAALRGHDVSLYEQSSRLGGLLPLAAMIKGTEIENLPALVRYLERQVRQAGVKVHLGRSVKAALIEREKPDVVVCATGGLPSMPKIPGIDQGWVVSTESLHRQAKFFLRFAGPGLLRKLSHLYMPIGREVIIIGGQLHGCETAEFLTKLGRKVTVIEAGEMPGRGAPHVSRSRLLWWLAKKGVHLLYGATILEVTQAGVKVITRQGERQELKADTIMAVIPPAPNNALCESLLGKVPEVYRIGDAKEEPKFILGAIGEGAEVGRSI